MLVQFDPSRGVDGYSPAEYQKALSRYTDNRISPYSSGQNYMVLAQRSIVAAQRWNGIAFEEHSLLPRIQIPLPRYEHYVPGMKYSPAELKAFYKHYGVKTIPELDDVHTLLELYYPLDPSFVWLGQWLQSDAPPEVIRYLCALFGVKSRTQLFTHHYVVSTDMVIDPDIDRSRLLSNPEDFFSDDPAPVLIHPTPRTNEKVVHRYTPASPAYQILLQRAREAGVDTQDKSTLDIQMELGDPISKEYQNYITYLQHRTFPPDDSEVSIIIQSTNPLSQERRRRLSLLPTVTLQHYTSRRNIVALDPVSRSNQRHDIVTALMFVRSSDPISIEPFNYDKIETYTVSELSHWLQEFGMHSIDTNRLSLVNDLYFLQTLPTFFDFRSDRVAYGTQQNFEWYTYYDLLQGFEQGRDPLFNIPSLRRLRQTLGSNLPELTRFLEPEPCQTSRLQFLYDVPDTPVTMGGTYRQFIFDLLDNIHDLGLQFQPF
jgi:hypothetical protein